MEEKSNNKKKVQAACTEITINVFIYTNYLRSHFSNYKYLRTMIENTTQVFKSEKTKKSILF